MVTAASPPQICWRKKHILGVRTLTGAYARAAQLSGSKIAATSLLAIKKHILGTAPIVQK